MLLFTSDNLGKAKDSAKGQLEELASDLLPATSPHHEARKQEFLTALEDDDYKRLNTMINEALERYFGNSTLLAGLSDFCERMGAPSNVSEAGEDSMLSWIAGHAAEISGKLDEEAKNATK